MGRKGRFWSSCYIVTLCLSQLLFLISAAFPSFREAWALCAWEYLSIAYLKINKQEKWVITSEITRLDLSTVRGQCCYMRNARKTCSKWMKKSGAFLLCRALDFCLIFYDIFWRSFRRYWAFLKKVFVMFNSFIYLFPFQRCESCFPSGGNWLN